MIATICATGVDHQQNWRIAELLPWGGQPLDVTRAAA
jgi:hypothetical protein